MMALLVAAVLAQSQPAWPRLEVRQVIDVDGTQQVGQRTVKLQRITVRESQEAVLRAFLDSFDRAGLYVPPPEDQLQPYRDRVTLTALDPKTMGTFVVTVWNAESGGGTEILSGASELSGQPQKPGVARELLPPSAESSFETRDEGHATCTFSSKESVAKVMTAMRTQATAKGYRVDERDGAWLFQRGERRVEVRARSVAGVTRVSMLVYGADAP